MSNSNIVSDRQNSFDHPTLFVPRWLECPYRFPVRLVWAAAIDLARRGHKITPSAIQQITSQSPHTIRKALRALAKDNLATVGGRTIELIEPAEDACYWHRKENGKRDSWLNSFAYDAVELDPSRTALENVVMARRRGLTYAKRSALAEMVGVHRETIGLVIKRLKGGPQVSESALNNGIENEHFPTSERAHSDTTRADSDIEWALSDTSNKDHKGNRKEHAQCSATLAPQTVPEDAYLDVSGLAPLSEAEREEYERNMLWWKESKEEKNKEYLCRIGCDLRGAMVLLKLWEQLLACNHFLAEQTFGHLSRHYSETHLAAKGAKNPPAWIIADLKEQLGIQQRKEPGKPKPTPMQLALAKHWSERSEHDERLAALHEIRKQLSEVDRIEKQNEVRKVEALAQAKKRHEPVQEKPKQSLSEPEDEPEWKIVERMEAAGVL